MPKIVALPPMTEDPAGDDLLPIHNTSTGDTEKVSIADITGSLNSGWVAVADTWEYSSWTSGTSTGVITIPAGGTSLYGVGMRIRITQTTGGTKYGIIVAVTSTELTVYFGTDYTLNNETITLPAYSQNKAPLGFPLDPAKWTQRYTYTDENSTTSSSYSQVGSHQLTLPIGAWLFRTKTFLKVTMSGVNEGAAIMAYSTSTSSASDPELIAGSGRNTFVSGATERSNTMVTVDKHITVASPTTYYEIFKRFNAGTASVDASMHSSSGSTSFMEAICAYL